MNGDKTKNVRKNIKNVLLNNFNEYILNMLSFFSSEVCLENNNFPISLKRLLYDNNTELSFNWKKNSADEIEHKDRIIVFTYLLIFFLVLTFFINLLIG